MVLAAGRLGHLYRYDLRTGALLGQVTSGQWAVRRILRVDEAERVVYFTASNADIADRLAGKLLLIHGEMDDQVHPDHTLRLADRLIAADKDFELLIVPGAEHTFIDCLAYVRKRCWDFLVRELMGTQPPAYRPAPIAIDPELLGELFA